MLHSFSKTKEALEKVGIFLLFLALFCFLSERSITKFLHLKAGMDTGLFENILYNTLHGDFFYTFLGPVDLWHSYFSDHVDLILFLILPFYYLFPQTETLFILQAFFLSSPILILYFYSKDKIDRPVIPSVLYALYLPVYWIGIFDIHPEVAFIPLFLLFMIQWEKKNLRYAFTLFLFCLFCKEEIAFVFIVFSALVRKEEPKFALLLFLISISYFCATIGILSFNNPFSGIPMHVGRYSEIPKDSYLFGPLLFFLLTPFLIFPFLSRYLLLVLPYLAYSFLSNAIPNKTPFTHHSFVAVPILFVAFLSGYDFLKKKGKAADWILATCALTFLYLFLSQGPPNKKYNYKEDFLRGSVTKEQVDFLRNYDPEANIVSNVPSVLGNRKIIRVFRGKKYSSEETIILFTGDHLADFDLSPVLQTHSDTHSLRKIGPDIALLEPKKKSPTR